MRSAVLVSLIVLVGCGGGPRAQVQTAIDARDVAGALDAYDRVRASDGDDAGLLARVAELMLIEEASGGDAERSALAIHELGLAGTMGRPALDRLASSGQILALVALARAGDGGARSTLRGMSNSADPEVRAAALMGADVESERALLLAAVVDSSSRVRQAAVSRLSELAPATEMRLVLEDRARVDPDPSVRSAAARSLGSFGTAALDLLRERLSDPVASVRSAAVESILRADRDAARGIFAGLLAMPPSSQGIDAARLLATPVDRDVPPTDADATSARTYLVGALSASDPNLRGQAAVALSGLPGREGALVAVQQALARETDPSVRLSIARALLTLPGGENDALAALRGLVSDDHGMAGVQAASILAERHDEAAVARLDAALTEPDASLRKVAARALARDALLPSHARIALSDSDPEVRIAAAGGILAAGAAE